MIITLQWHYEKYLPHNASVLLDNMQYLIDGSLNWDEWYQEDIYITQDLNTVPVSETRPLFSYEYGVNVGQGGILHVLPPSPFLIRGQRSYLISLPRTRGCIY